MANDVFISLKPKYIKPTGTEDILTPPEKDNRPARPLKEQAYSKRVYELLQQAKQLSAKQIEKALKESPKSKERETLTELQKPKKAVFCEAHIIESDEEFIAITRKLEPGHKAIYPLLVANGGSRFLKSGFTLAQAFDLLRREKQNNLLKGSGKSFDKYPARKIEHTYVAGVPTTEDLWRKAWQRKIDDQLK